MISLEQLFKVLPFAIEWAEEQERIILEKGIPLNEDLKALAALIGVEQIEKIRLLQVTNIPSPTNPILQPAAELAALTTKIGVAFRYGMYVKADYWLQRRLIIHELTHTLQYERLGGIGPFIKQYLMEVLTEGYFNSSLEQEALRTEQKLSEFIS